MDEGSWLSFAVIFALLGCAVYFAMTETAFSSVSRTRLRLRAEKGDTRAKKALFILDDFDRAITTILIGTNIVHLTAAAMVTVIVTRLWGNGAVIWGTVFTTLLLFFAGELLPKTVAKRYSERLSLATAGSLRFFMRLFAPVSAVLTLIGQSVSKLVKGDAEVSVTEDELYDIIEDMTDAGSLDEEQGDLVQSALEFADVTVENVLTARVDMDAVDIAWTPEQVADFIRSCRHSRLPVYEGQIDNIIGILSIRTFIRTWLTEKETLDLRSLLDAPYFVPATTKVDDLLPEMSRHRRNLAIVTDPWGGTLGLVTVEDILEELVGEIWDEEDVVEEYFRPIGGGRYELDARLTVEDAFDLLKLDAPEEEDIAHKSLAEWTLTQFDLMPAQRDTFTYAETEFTVSDVYRNRIRKLTARRVPTAEGGEVQ